MASLAETSIAGTSPPTQAAVQVVLDENEPVQQLFKLLDADLRRDATGPNVRRLIEEYMKKHEDWKEYMHFNPHKYSRNLINANDTLELMVICWLEDQVSPIHNHAGQHCWAAVLEGNIRETHFHYKNTRCCHGSGPLETAKKSVYSTGHVSYISDDIALHVLEPVDGKRAATMHLYSKPIAECNIYCKESGEITKRRLGYYTIGKKLNPAYSNPCGAAGSCCGK